MAAEARKYCGAITASPDIRSNEIPTKRQMIKGNDYETP